MLSDFIGGCCQGEVKDAEFWAQLQGGKIMRVGGARRWLGVMFTSGALFLICAAAAAANAAPKHGGTLTYMIAADVGPSLDGHRETTFAVLQATAPFYSVLIRINPDNPSSTADFRCDLCSEMPQPADNGLTYTFKIQR